MPYKDPNRQREYQKNWLQERRLAWLAENGPCVVCGSGNDLQIDHIDSQDKVSHKVWSWSKEKREAELSKCQVLCVDCHINKSRTEISQLNEEHIVEIRTLYSAGTHSQRELGKMFNLSHAEIWRIIHRLRWKHVK